MHTTSRLQDWILWLQSERKSIPQHDGWLATPVLSFFQWWHHLPNPLPIIWPAYFFLQTTYPVNQYNLLGYIDSMRLTSWMELKRVPIPSTITTGSCGRFLLMHWGSSTPSWTWSCKPTNSTSWHNFQIQCYDYITQDHANELYRVEVIIVGKFITEICWTNPTLGTY